MNKAAQNIYDLIILDVNITGMNGFKVCENIKSKNNIPISMLTALGTPENKMQGFEAGVDDYLLKPFEFKELIARIKVLLRRNNIIENVNFIDLGRLFVILSYIWILHLKYFIII